MSVIILAGAFGLFEFELSRGASLAEARTMAVNVVYVVEIFYLFNARSLTRSPFQLGFVSNPWTVGGAILMALIQLLYTYAPFMNALFDSAPISLALWLDVLAVGLAAYVIIEEKKWLRRRLGRRPGFTVNPNSCNAYSDKIKIRFIQTKDYHYEKK